MPPDLTQALSGAGQQPAPQPSQGDMGTGMAPAEHLRMAIEHAQAALVGTPDDADSQQLAKVVQGLYQILANKQKQQDQVMGMTPALRGALGG